MIELRFCGGKTNEPLVHFMSSRTEWFSVTIHARSAIHVLENMNGSREQFMYEVQFMHEVQLNKMN